ncbi:MAG: hypothetical protein ACI82H_002337, partial [Alphaproteobacteria bacterium]
MRHRDPADRLGRLGIIGAGRVCPSCPTILREILMGIEVITCPELAKQTKKRTVV